MSAANTCQPEMRLFNHSIIKKGEAEKQTLSTPALSRPRPMNMSVSSTHQMSPMVEKEATAWHDGMMVNQGNHLATGLYHVVTGALSILELQVTALFFLTPKCPNGSGPSGHSINVPQSFTCLQALDLLQLLLFTLNLTLQDPLSKSPFSCQVFF